MTRDNVLSSEYFTALLGTEIVSVERMSGGGNSRAIKVTAAAGEKYAAKVYPGLTADGLDRREVEFNALRFLRNLGFDCVPCPIASDTSMHCAVFEYIDGSPITSQEVTREDIDQISGFLVRLGEICHDSETAVLPNAAEACFSLQAIIKNLISRLESLRVVRAAGLTEFLTDEFVPALRRNVNQCRNSVRDTELELELARRTLSPSDFGFHNALRRPDGRLAFLDFEYFGWDDPAKMVSDFLLHPAMDLNLGLKARFAKNMAHSFKKDPNFSDRLEMVFPLFGLKWCMILLNVFLPSYRQQRGLSESESAGIKKLQLEKAKLVLSIVESGYERFPFRDEETSQCHLN